MARYLSIHPDDPQPRLLAQAAEAVRAGVAAASELEFYRVAPIKAQDEGPQVIAPDAGPFPVGPAS